uniref:Large ribosomal subunit protein uL22c n=1 Tax=Selaginella lepidophylla TaxID=59777 RepID=A0A3Q9R2R6_SELLP|nr:ribosomal protein L22 [Selaginella lepidophylla]AZU95846.1 ribosomal protein L22 [Selaginella lepidophylla]
MSSDGSLSPEVWVKAKHINISASKLRRVADQIRYRSYEQALMILESMPYRACSPVLRLISAAASAGRTAGLSKAELFVGRAEVGRGKYYKRIRPRAQGRAYPMRRHTCNVAPAVRHGRMRRDERIDQ